MTDYINKDCGLLSPEDMALAQSALEIALKEGASKARANLSCSVMDLVATLNGQVDKVTHSFDRSLTMYIFADGRYGTFSTNRVSAEGLTEFIRKGLETVRALSPDPCRNLPDINRTAMDAGSGLELGLWDPERNDMDPGRRRAIALEASIWPKEGLISEEGEYSDSVSDIYMVDTQGLECRHIETSFEYGVEVTAQDKDGNRYSGYWWDSSPKLENLEIGDCGLTAMKRAVAQFAPQDFPLGRPQRPQRVRHPAAEFLPRRQPRQEGLPGQPHGDRLRKGRRAERIQAFRQRRSRHIQLHDHRTWRSGRVLRNHLHRREDRPEADCG